MTAVLTLSGVSANTWSEDVTSAPKVLGRAESADIRLDHGSVSRQHCRVWMEVAACYVEDCGSTNGTWVNGERIERERLSNGDRILVGKFELLLAEKDQLRSTDEFELPISENAFQMIPCTHEPALPNQAPQRMRLNDPVAEERRLASAVHRRLTPCRRMCLPGLLVEVAYMPSGMLGGDCFECFELENRWVLAVFDPMNHGTKAALTIMLLRAELKRWIELAPEPARCLEWINRELVSLGISDLYICAGLAVWFPGTQVLVYSTAGQHPPLLIRKGRIVDLGQTAGGMPLGVQADGRFEEHLSQLKPKDRIFFFTDGVGDALRGTHTVDATASLVAKRLLSCQGEGLQIQVQRIFDDRPNEFLDDALLAGCEVTLLHSLSPAG